MLSFNRNSSYSISCIFVATSMCLVTHYLAMDVQVTVLYEVYQKVPKLGQKRNAGLTYSEAAISSK
jgi:hypothetical protein